MQQNYSTLTPKQDFAELSMVILENGLPYRNMVEKIFFAPRKVRMLVLPLEPVFHVPLFAFPSQFCSLTALRVLRALERNFVPNSALEEDEWT